MLALNKRRLNWLEYGRYVCVTSSSLGNLRNHDVDAEGNVN